MSDNEGAEIKLRHEVMTTDAKSIGAIVSATGFFNAEEVAIAIELVEERLQRGAASGYHFVIAQVGGRVVGYTCYGPIDGTQCSFDLFWIATAPEQQGRGIGRVLMAETERLIRAMGGQRVYAETSGRAQYEPTRAFYQRLGFDREAELQHFYAPGDAKVFFVKAL